jgi:hypothetical protein
MRRVADPADPKVRLGHGRRHATGNLTLDRGLSHHTAHDGGHSVDRLGGRDARCLQRFARVVDPLRGVGIGEGFDRSGDRRQLRAPVDVRRAPDAPDRGELLLRRRRRDDPTNGERPRCPIRPGVLYTEVQDAGPCEADGRLVELLRPYSEADDL